MRPGYSIYLGGLCRIDFKEGPPGTYFTLFVSSALKVHVCKTIKAEQLYERHLGGMLSPPTTADPADIIPTSLEYKPLTPLVKALNLNTEGAGERRARRES